MDFSLTDEQRALANLAGQILADRSGVESLKVIERSADGFDRQLWAELAKAGLLGVSLPEADGGSGGGFIDLCLLLEQQGKRVAPLPLVATLVSAALPIARFGTPQQRERYLPGVVRGETILSAALSEIGSEARVPISIASRDGEGWRLNGVKVGVPFAQRAAAVLVPVRTVDRKVALFLVDPNAAGVKLERQEATNWESQFRMTMNNVTAGPDAMLGGFDNGQEILDWVVDRTTVALCAVASGACQEALRLTAEYASNRKQFDKPIAMFQAVGQRMADSYIDNEAVNVTMWQAASRLHNDTPSDKQIATAKYWAAEGGSRIGHAALHIHGGISIDVDYPIHRYFLWLKQIEFTLGAATPQLVRLGTLLAQE